VRRGFDEYFGTLLGHSDYYNYHYFDGTYQLRDGERPVKAEGYLTDLLNRRAVEFIGKHAGEPFFMYVPYSALHAPYQPPGRPEPSVTKENMNDGDRRAYAAMLEKVDEGVGMMQSELERLKLTENTLFVLSSDNGGAHFSDNTPLFNGKQSLWEGGIRVPCLMRWPARLPAGKVVRQAGITMDLTATFIAAAGAIPAQDRPLDGIDLLPILRGEQPEVTRTFCWRIDRNTRRQKAVRHGPWKYVHDAGYLHFLYNLDDDIGERRNVAIHNPEIVRELQQRLHAWEAEVDAHRKEFIVR
jgi:arylsulfatase A-like enzyme